MAPLEPWEKVFVDVEKFSATIHGQQTCISCHNGSASADMETAHTDMIAMPSQDSQKSCGTCHQKETAAYQVSLHNTQQGYWTALDARSIPENHPALEEMFGNHCSTCHTSCGECHVAQPENVGGGLFSGHLFEKTPPMTRSCTACHGSRVGNEYMGKNEELPGDVHFREARMNCVQCHTAPDLHGENTACVTCHTKPEDAEMLAQQLDVSALPDGRLAAAHRYAGHQTPTCESCHPQVVENPQNPMHTQHGQNLSCQVCHSITYTSCDGCHTAVSEKSGKPYFETESTYFTFLIGKNTRKSALRPYDYTVVRHVPISPTSFEYYGENLLPNFDALPTWMYATPHNIQLKTPQNESCAACHGNPDLFLTADKVAEGEQAANQGVIMDTLPPPMQ